MNRWADGHAAPPFALNTHQEGDQQGTLIVTEIGILLGYRSRFPGVTPDGLIDGGSTAVVEQGPPISQSPQVGSAEFAGTRRSLGNAVTGAYIMQQEIRVKRDWLPIE